MVDIFHAIEVLVLCVTSRKKVLPNPSAVDVDHKTNPKVSVQVFCPNSNDARFILIIV